MTAPIDRYVYDWCVMRHADGTTFTFGELEAYVMACCDVDSIDFDGPAMLRGLRLLCDANVVDMTATDRRGGHRVTAARGLDYRAPTVDPRQLEIGDWE